MRFARVAGSTGLLEGVAAGLFQCVGNGVFCILDGAAGISRALGSAKYHAEFAQSQLCALEDGNRFRAVDCQRLPVDLDSRAVRGDFQLGGGRVAQPALQRELTVGLFQRADIRVRDLGARGGLQQGCVSLRGFTDAVELVGDFREASESAGAVAGVFGLAQRGAGGAHASFCGMQRVGQLCDLLGFRVAGLLCRGELLAQFLFLALQGGDSGGKGGTLVDVTLGAFAGGGTAGQAVCCGLRFFPQLAGLVVLPLTLGELLAGLGQFCVGCAYLGLAARDLIDECRKVVHLCLGRAKGRSCRIHGIGFSGDRGFGFWW